MIVKILGVVDILAAIMLFFFDMGAFNSVKLIMVLILFLKGLPSLLG